MHCQFMIPNIIIVLNMKIKDKYIIMYLYKGVCCMYNVFVFGIINRQCIIEISKIISKHKSFL